MRRLSEAARAALQQVDPKTQKSVAERLIEMTVRRALQGSYRHLELLWAYAEGRPAQSVKLTGGVLHAHAWRPLASLTDEEMQQLAAIRKRLSGPGEDESKPAIEAEVWEPKGSDRPSCGTVATSTNSGLDVSRLRE
jgi:hypothetical protein